MSNGNTIELKIKLTDQNAAKELGDIAVKVDGVAAAVESAARAAGEATSVFGNVTDKLFKLQTVGNAVSGLGDFLGRATAPAMEFEQGMADLSAITGVVGDELDLVAATARRVGRESGLGAATAARAFTLLASNIQVPIEQYEGLLEMSARLSQATGMGIDEAAASLASTVNQFGLSTADAGRVINVLAAGSKYGAAEVADLSQSFKVVGASASALGLSVEDTAGALEVLSKAGVKGSESGTHLRNVLLALATKTGADLRVTSLSDALAALRPRLQDTAWMAETFGTASLAAAQYLVGNAEAVRDMTDAVSGTETAFEQAETRNATWSHRLEVMRAGLQDVGIAIGSALGPVGAFGAVAAEAAGQAVTLGQAAEMARGLVSHMAAAAAWVGRTAAAQRVAAVATRAWAAAQAAFNVVASLNPAGLIALGIAALVAAIGACVAWFDTWGEVALTALGLVGWLIASIVRHWESLKAAFAEGGLAAGMRRLGQVMMDAVLAPMQKLLGWVAELTGWDWVRRAAEWTRDVSAANDLFAPAEAPAAAAPGAAPAAPGGAPAPPGLPPPSTAAAAWPWAAPPPRWPPSWRPRPAAR